MKVSVIIVSYNAANYLEQCLYSLQKAITADIEVIIFDNCSTETGISDLANVFTDFKFIFSEDNLGFSKGNNKAVESAKGEYVFILNPDTLIPEDFFEKIIPIAESKKDLGALGVRMIDKNGKFHPESKRNIPTPFSSFKKLFSPFSKVRKSGYYNLSLDEFENGKTSILTGACMLMKRENYIKVGGFDERYFMYGEDIDLSYTLLQNGMQNYYIGEISIIHYKGESTVKDKVFLERFYGAMELFIDKYYKHQTLKRAFLKLGLKLNKRFKGLKINQKEKENICKELQKWNNNNELGCFLLDGNDWDNKKIIKIISDNFHDERFFFIKPKNMEEIL